MKNHDEELQVTLRALIAMLEAQKQRGDVVQEIRDGLQRLEAAILQLGDVIRAQKYYKKDT